MPRDNLEINTLLDLHRKGLERLSNHLHNLCKQRPVPLNERRLGKYKNLPRGAVAGWTIKVPDIHYRIIVFVDSRYPFSVPKTAIDFALPIHKYPHIDEDGYLCINEIAVPISEDDLEEVATEIIQQSVNLIKDCLSGSNKEDLQEEILSYWSRLKTKDAPECVSFLDLSLAGCSRVIKIWENIGDSNAVFIADSATSGEKWINQKFGKQKRLKSTNALFVWSNSIPIPEHYPENNREAYEFIKNSCDKKSIELFGKLAETVPKKIFVFVGFNTTSGIALVSIVFNKPRDKSSYQMTASQRFIKGFRPGKMHHSVARTRYANPNSKVDRLFVQRVDASWILARDSEPSVNNLKEKVVTVIGCGSIGSEIIKLLAQNGIQHFHLIDPDTMDWENVGRHVLGADAMPIGKKYTKVSCLANFLKLQFPHINIHSTHSRKWEDVFLQEKTPFYESDLLIMATGDWPAENAISLLSNSETRFPRILYGWAEPYAVAGHSFISGEIGASFNCVFEGARFKYEVCKFDDPLKSMPACGGTFQPFRSIDLAPIAALISSQVIDALIENNNKSEIRSWVGSKEVAVKYSGNFTEHANELLRIHNSPNGQLIYRDRLDKCSRCTGCNSINEV